MEPVGAETINAAIKQRGNGFFVHNLLSGGGHGAYYFTSISKQTESIMGNTVAHGDGVIKSLLCETCEEVRL